jgi:hypothetical protein
VVRACPSPVGWAQLFLKRGNNFLLFGAPASLIGLELPQTGLPPFALPRPDALSPLLPKHSLRAHNTRRCAHPLAGGPSRSGRGYGSLSMRIQRPAADMFSLSLQVVGKM